MARIIACCNAKGGTGKTTTAVNLSACLALNHGKKVLGIDLDAQGNFGIALGLDPRQIQFTSFHWLTTDSPDFRKYIFEVKPNFHLIPNAIAVDLENKLESSHNRESLLKIRMKQVSSHYDYIIIDTPPAMRTPTMNAIVAAHEIIVVLDCGYFAMYGLTDLLRQIARAQDAYEKYDLVVRGLLNLFNKNQNLDRDLRREVEEQFGSLMINTIIHKNVKLAEATSAHLPVIEYDRTSSGAFDFLKLTKELLSEYEPETEKRLTRLAQ